MWSLGAVGLPFSTIIERGWRLWAAAAGLMVAAACSQTPQGSTSDATSTADSPGGDTGMSGGSLVALLPVAQALVGVDLLRCVEVFGVTEAGTQRLLKPAEVELSATPAGLVELAAAGECVNGLGVVGLAAGSATFTVRATTLLGKKQLDVPLSVQDLPLALAVSGPKSAQVLPVGTHQKPMYSLTYNPPTPAGWARAKWLDLVVADTKLALVDRPNGHEPELVGAAAGSTSYTVHYAGPHHPLVSEAKLLTVVAAGTLIAMKSMNFLNDDGSQFQPSDGLAVGSCFVVQAAGVYQSGSTLWTAPVALATFQAVTPAVVASGTARFCLVSEGEVALDACQGQLCVRGGFGAWAKGAVEKVSLTLDEPGPFAVNWAAMFSPTIGSDAVTCAPLHAIVTAHGKPFEITNWAGVAWSAGLSQSHFVKGRTWDSAANAPLFLGKFPCFDVLPPGPPGAGVVGFKVIVHNQAAMLDVPVKW